MRKMQGSNLGRMLLQPTTVLGWADGRVVIGTPPGSYPAQAEPTNTPTAGEGIPMILLTYYSLSIIIN